MRADTPTPRPTAAPADAVPDTDTLIAWACDRATWHAKQSAYWADHKASNSRAAAHADEHATAATNFAAVATRLGAVATDTVRLDWLERVQEPWHVARDIAGQMVTLTRPGLDAAMKYRATLDAPAGRAGA